MTVFVIFKIIFHISIFPSLKIFSTNSFSFTIFNIKLRTIFSMHKFTNKTTNSRTITRNIFSNYSLLCITKFLIQISKFMKFFNTNLMSISDSINFFLSSIIIRTKNFINFINQFKIFNVSFTFFAIRSEHSLYYSRKSLLLFRSIIN